MSLWFRATPLCRQELKEFHATPPRRQEIKLDKI